MEHEKVSKYVRSEIAITAMEALEMIGIVNKLNINGYHISIDGLRTGMHEAMTDDTPSNHEVTIERNKFIKSLNKKQFNSLSDKDLNDMLAEQSKMDIDFIQKDNVSIIHNISHDSSNYVWYKHKVTFNIEQLVLETLESYVKRVFEETANYVIESFETMQNSQRKEQ